MAYEQFEEIRSRKSEKIALFLTMENAVGLILAAFPAYLVSVGLPFVLRIVIVLLAALLGISATLEVRGMPFYEHVLWRVRGVLRKRVGGDIVTPEQLIGAASIRLDRPLLVGGAVQLRPHATRASLPHQHTPKPVSPVLAQPAQHDTHHQEDHQG